MRYEIKKTKAGFSLIELVVSLSIIAMITVLFMANYKTGNKRTDLVMTAQRLVADIHLAQNNSLGLVKYNGEVPAGGWGISLDMAKGGYTLFADLNAPGTSGSMSYNPDTEGNTSYGARLTDFSSTVVISSLKIGSTYVSTTDITFLPPDPITNIYSAGATSTDLEIKLQEKNNPTNIKTIRINFLGLAEVID